MIDFHAGSDTWILSKNVLQFLDANPIEAETFYLDNNQYVNQLKNLLDMKPLDITKIRQFNNVYRKF